MVLTLEGVSKSFGKDNTYVEALKATDFHLERGEMVAIVGPSGSGKSTLLTIAGLLQKPSSGRIIINDTNTTDYNEKKRSQIRLKEIGFILQASNLVPFLKVKDQLKLLDKVNRNHLSKEELAEKVQTLGLEKVMNQYPSELSGGQRQRVAILKAIYTKPSVILADEPTASLDSEKAFAVIELIREEVRGMDKAAIVVTHDTRLTKYFDKVYEMKDGYLNRIN
ncbi:ABC transporter ATP-binding protein [Macrococcus hajekii]|uniref:Putative hemin import ATP-binding protein HrtA n=1 Tax=Macrococcus hajekii TaxID=198482 RepID=A0A4R6BK41_9STAP|nr:ABC transporter ATP-binding protein [Macrococcus hajekii]TDM02089.1 ABC transporter ATP-binding protein [Macrococcus hajekii]GGB10007.1 ABC transporter ATP-binding protein [Macrococcus hajekii]